VLVSAIIILAHSPRFSVVAEGVATHGQSDPLRSMICDEMQAYLFGKPIGNAHSSLNVVVADLGKLGADPYAFGDSNPVARFEYLLRSVHRDFEGIPKFFG
jgi:hypothetical protein